MHGSAALARVKSADLDCTDAGEATSTDDCDDAVATVYKGATEVPVDGVDQNCNGGDACYFDNDKDGYGNKAGAFVDGTDFVCDPSAQESDNKSDCDDVEASDYPGAPETAVNGDDEDCDGGDDCYADADLDKHGSAALARVKSADLDCVDTGEASSTDDCDDAVATVYLGAPEVPVDGVDQNCNGGDACYVDFDKDGYGTEAGTVADGADLVCDTALQEADDKTDCDDGDAGDHPGATEEIANGDDEDCDTYRGDTCYKDDDGDTYGDSSGVTVVSTNLLCTDAGEARNMKDCDDVSSGDNPAATEIVGNSDDENCNNAEICYVDSDKDGYGADSGVTSISTADLLCLTADKEADDAEDCADADPAIKPGATDLTGDSVDQDCDDVELCYVDSDKDGYGDESGATVPSTLDTLCLTVNKEADDTDDCDDSDIGDYPGATEIAANGDDDDCDALRGDTCYKDDDDDTYGDISGATVASADLDCVDAGESKTKDDCDDVSGADNPGATEIVGNEDDDDCKDGELCYLDADLDGYGTETGTTYASTTDVDCKDANESTVQTDCDDTKAAVKPLATELTGDSVDQNCDDVEVCYVDVDKDGYGNDSGATVLSTADTLCSTADQEANDTDDCDDAKPSVYLGATETVGDGIDQDCDDVDSCYYDADMDGYGVGTIVDGKDLGCDVADKESKTSDDCDDASFDDNPGATEIVANADDDDCVDGELCYIDGDGDTYGTTSTVASANLSCGDSGEAGVSTDCLDGNAAAYPGHAEVWYNGVDNDCSGSTLVQDYDQDGDGQTSDDYTVGDKRDCDDTVATTYKGATDAWYDGVDADCAGDSDYDQDGDGYTSDAYSVGSQDDCDDTDADVNPMAWDRYDGVVDDDCEGTVDRSDVTSHPAVYTMTGTGWLAPSALGDMDRDGRTDIAVGAREYDRTSPATLSDVGIVYVEPLASGALGGDLSFYGENASDGAGWAVAGLSDFNGDGKPADLAIGVPGYDGSLVDGGAVCLIMSSASLSTGSLALTTSGGRCNTRLTGVSNADAAGSVLASAGYFNSDASGDLGVGVPAADPGGKANAGTVYLIIGAGSMPSSSLSSAAWTTLHGAAVGDAFGSSLAGDGDIDGDGLDDFVIGAPGVDPTTGSGAGAAYVLLGDATPVASATATWIGAAAGDSLGAAVATGGDYDADGYDDVLLGAPNVDDGSLTNVGAAYLIYGASTPTGGTAGTDSDDELLGASKNEGAGSSVAFLGELDASGGSEIGIAAPALAYTGSSSTYFVGQVYVAYNGEALSGTSIMYGAKSASVRLGTSLSGVGDADSDGYDDFAVGYAADTLFLVRGHK